MEDILVCRDENGNGAAFLTTNSPQSHYGIPVLRVESEDVAGDYGPGDWIGEPEKGVLAAHVIYGWALMEGRTVEEVHVARRFLSQWPQGPQIFKIENGRVVTHGEEKGA